MNASTRISLAISDADLKRLRELGEQGQTSIATVARTLIQEADFWRRVYDDPEPREYVLPGGQIVQNRAAIEQSFATRLLGDSNTLLQDIDSLQDELNRLRSQLRNEMQASLAAHSVFISHAREDKQDVARPLAEMLVSMSIKVWYDEYSLKLGDSLRKSIDRGLAECKFGVVILSPAFLAKSWTQYELDGLVGREMQDGGKVILPVWHAITAQELSKFSPTLAGRVAVQTSDGIQRVVSAIIDAMA